MVVYRYTYRITFLSRRRRWEKQVLFLLGTMIELGGSNAADFPVHFSLLFGHRCPSLMVVVTRSSLRGRTVSNDDDDEVYLSLLFFNGSGKRRRKSSFFFFCLGLNASFFLSFFLLTGGETEQRSTTRPKCVRTKHEGLSSLLPSAPFVAGNPARAKPTSSMREVGGLLLLLLSFFQPEKARPEREKERALLLFRGPKPKPKPKRLNLELESRASLSTSSKLLPRRRRPRAHTSSTHFFDVVAYFLNTEHSCTRTYSHTVVMYELHTCTCTT